MKYLAFLLMFLASFAGAQSPQSQTDPIYAVNAKYVNGIAPGYAPTAGRALNLNLSSGTALCTTVQQYPGGILVMIANTTNYVYLDVSNSCTPSSSTTPFALATQIPLAIITTTSVITNINDLRTPFTIGQGATGSGIVANQVNGVIPLATAPTVIGAISPLTVTSGNVFASANITGLKLGDVAQARQYQTSPGSNDGIFNAQASNPMVVADPSYAFTEFPGPFSFTAPTVFYQDDRNSQQTNVYINPQVTAGSNFNWGLYPFNGAVATPGAARTLGVGNWCVYNNVLAFAPYCQAVGQQTTFPGFSLGLPAGYSGGIGGWYNDETFNVNTLSRNAGISGAVSIISFKDGIGDNDGIYSYHHNRGGRTAQADESHVGLGLNEFEDPDYVSTCTSGCTHGSQSIVAGIGNQGVGQYLIDTTQSPLTGHITANGAGLGGGSAWTTDTAITPSNAWGTCPTINTPNNGVPPFTTSETVTCTVTSGTFVANTMVCFGGAVGSQGSYHEQAIPTVVTGSPPTQTLTFALRRPHPNNGVIMQGGPCGGIELSYFTTTGGTRYVFDVIGATGANTLQVGQFIAGIYSPPTVPSTFDQISNFTNATASSGTTVSFVYTGAGSTIFHPWDYVNASWTFTGSSDSALNAVCAGAQWTTQALGTCTIVGLTGTHTTTTPLVGTLSANAYKIWPVAETTDVQDYVEANCNPSNLNAGPHAPCVDGTLSLEPNTIQFATSDGVEQLNHPSQNMKGISDGLSTKNPFELLGGLNIGISGYGNAGGGNSVSGNGFINITSQGVVNQFTNVGGILTPPNLINAQGPYNIALNIQGPTAEQPIINVQTSSAQLANPNYFYMPFQDSNVAGSGFKFVPKSNEMTLNGNVVIGSPLGLTTLSDNIALTKPVAPTPTFTQSATGGTLGTGTFCYRIAIRNIAGGPGIPGTEACSTFASGATNLLTVKWNRVSGAVSYYVYGRTSGAELLMPTGTALPVNTLNFVDDGTTTPSGAIPTTDLTTPNITGAQSVSFLSQGTAFTTSVVATANNGANNTITLPSGSGTVLISGQATPSQQFSQVAIGQLSNYVENSGTMSGTGWATAGSAVATAGQSDPFGGTNAVEVATTVNTDYYTNSGASVTNGVSYIACGWGLGAVGGERENIAIGNNGASVFFTSSWALYSVTITAGAGGTPARFSSVNNSAQTVFLYGWNVVPATMDCLSPGFQTGATPQPIPINTVLTPQVNTNAILPGVIYSAAGTALPSCATASKGQMSVVSDATGPTYLGTYTSGGAVVAPVMCNGTAWVTY